MNIKDIRTEDIEEATRLSPENWSHIAPRIEFYIKHNFCHSIKLIDKEEILGIGTLVLFKNTSWIGHLIVKDGCRGNGYGKKILEYLCEYAKSNGHKTISLFTTDIGYPLYLKYGFEVQTEYVQYEKIPDETPDKTIETYNANINIKNIETKDYEKILKIDRVAAGEDRSELLLSFTNNGFVYKQKNEVTGFYLSNLGEGLVIAENEEAGVELLKLRASTKKQAIVPIDNIAGNNYCSANNFKEIAKVKKMMYGEKIKGQYENIYNRATGSSG